MKKFLILSTLALMSLCAFAQSIPVPGGGRAQRAASGTPSNGQVPSWNSSTGQMGWSTSGSGDASGPGSSTNNNLVRFSGTGGKTLKDSSVNVDDSGNVSTPGSLSIGSGSNPALVSLPNGGTITNAANAVALTNSLPVVFGSNVVVKTSLTTPTATISASAIDVSTGTLFTKSLAADTTFTFSNPTEGQGFTVVVTNSSTYVVTWPTVEWKGGSTPAQSATQTDVYSFLYANGKYLGVQTPGSPPGVEQEAYSAGTVYSLTATAALLDFGTTDPTVTVTAAGTYMIYWGGNYKYNGATFAANQTANMKVRRTNNTAADISNATLTATTRIITTVTDDLAVLAGKPVKYTAAAGDILQVWGSLSATPAAGSVDCTDAWIVILRIQ